MTSVRHGENYEPVDSIFLQEQLRRTLTNCVVIDCETTGLDPAEDVLIEIAALRVRNGCAVAVFHRMVSPSRPVPAVVTGLTGISEDDLQSGEDRAEAVRDLTGFLQDVPLVGHNIAFDLGFLRAACSHLVFDPPETLCTADTARRLVPRSRVGRYRLSTLSQVFELAHRPTHRAVHDVRATLDLLRMLSVIPADD